MPKYINSLHRLFTTYLKENKVKSILFSIFLFIFLYMWLFSFNIFNLFDINLARASYHVPLPPGSPCTANSGCIYNNCDDNVCGDPGAPCNADQECRYNNCVGNVCTGPISRNAQFINQDGIPSTMCQSQVATATIRMKNTGNTIWKSVKGYKLASENPADNINWGFNRVSLPSDINPNDQAVFTFNFTSPATIGIYNFQWKMIQEGVERFGESTTNVPIEVLDCTKIYDLAINPKQATYSCSADGVCDYVWHISANDNSNNLAPTTIKYVIDDTSRKGWCDLSVGIYNSTQFTGGDKKLNGVLPSGAKKITSIDVSRKTNKPDAFVIYVRNRNNGACTVNLRIISPDSYLVDPNFTVSPPLPPGLTQCPNGDSDCKHYEYCDTTGDKTGFPNTCYDFRPDTGGCTFYDYCKDGKDASNPGISCSSDWDSYCYINDPDQVTLIRNKCVDTTFVDHNMRSACGEG